MIKGISAVTFATHDMARSIQFYSSLGFELKFGGADASFSSLFAGSGFVNLVLQSEDREWQWWGRVIFHVEDVVKIYNMALAAGYSTDGEPENASWGERYFHITDLDGHELSFARMLDE